MTAKLLSPRERQLCVLLREVVIDGNWYRIKRDAVQCWIVNQESTGRRGYMFTKRPGLDS